MEDEPKTKPVRSKAIKPSRVTNAFVVDVFGSDGQKKSSLSLPDELFNVTVSDKLLAQYVRVYLVNQRQGTRKVKSRGEIALSTRKIYRQKGTGRARHGAKSAPIFVGGGVAHGPSPKEYLLKLNKKQKRKALLGSLSRSIKNKTIFVWDGVSSSLKTKDISKVVHAIIQNELHRVLLIYVSSEEKNLYTSTQNIEDIHAVDTRIVNAYDVLKARHIVFTQKAIDDFIHFRIRKI